MRLREASKTVIAYGDRASPRELVNACDKFVYVDILGLDIDKELCDVGEAEANAGAELINAGGAGRARPRCYSPEELRKNNVLIELLSKAVRARAEREEGEAATSRRGPRRRCGPRGLAPVNAAAPWTPRPRRRRSRPRRGRDDAPRVETPRLRRRGTSALRRG